MLDIGCDGGQPVLPPPLDEPLLPPLPDPPPLPPPLPLPLPPPGGFWLWPPQATTSTASIAAPRQRWAGEPRQSRRNALMPLISLYPAESSNGEPVPTRTICRPKRPHESSSDDLRFRSRDRPRTGARARRFASPRRRLDEHDDGRSSDCTSPDDAV